jgi:L-ascorbate metabolism protein UlaG (beta-lactamase superfamily)
MAMKIKWYGHSAFLITTAKGVRIITTRTNPAPSEGDLAYGKITDEADIVLSSHDHDDHNYTKDIRDGLRTSTRRGLMRRKGSA